MSHSINRPEAASCCLGTAVGQQLRSSSTAERLLSDCRWWRFLLSSVDLLTHFLISALSDLLLSYLPVSCHVAVSEYNFLG